MVVAKNKVVRIEYTLRDPAGNVLDRSEDGSPFDYLHGAANIVPGLEKALDGRSSGDALRVTVSPLEGYGERDDEMVLVVGRDRFVDGPTPEAGMRFHASTPEGHQIFTVLGVEGDQVTLDGNHPLAGETLHFDVKVVGIRDATREELEHGHPHGPDGHHH